ncbi:MAG TPA: hypothetical protein VGO93_14355 [Candidatus Xenobia bacterium]|jgi:hypothetical protein
MAREGRQLAISGKVTLDTSDILLAEKNLAEFGNLSEAELHKVINAAELTGRSAGMLAMTLSRVEETGGNATRALRQFGIVQQDLIKAGAETKGGKLFADPTDAESMDRFRAALEKVFDSKFGDASRMTQTLAGQMTIFKNTVNDASAGLGEQFEPVLIDVMHALEGAQSVAKYVPDVFKTLGAATLAVVAGFLTFQTGMKALTTVAPEAAAAMAPLIAEFGPLILLVGGAATAIEFFAAKSEEGFKKTEQAAKDATKAMEDAVHSWQAFERNVVSVGGTYTDSSNLDQAKAAIKDQIDHLTTNQKFALMGKEGLENVEDLKKAIADLDAQIEHSDGVQKANAERKRTAYQELYDQIKDVAAAIDATVKSAQALDEAFKFDKAVNGVENFKDEITRLQDKLEELAANRPPGLSLTHEGIEEYENSSTKNPETDKFIKQYKQIAQDLNAAKKGQAQKDKQDIQETLRDMRDGYNQQAALHDKHIQDLIAENEKERAVADAAGEAGKKDVDRLDAERARLHKQAGEEILKDAVQAWQERIAAEKAGAKQLLDEGKTTAAQYAASLHQIDKEQQDFIAGHGSLAGKGQAGKELLHGLKSGELSLGTEAAGADRVAQAKALAAELKSIDADIKTLHKNSTDAIVADYDREIAAVKKSGLNSEEQASKIEQLEDKKAAAVEAAVQRQEAAYQRLAAAERSLAQRQSKKVVQNFEAGKPGVSEQDVADALEANLGLQVQAIQAKEQKELSAAKTSEEAGAIQRSALLETLQAYQAMGDEIDSVRQKLDGVKQASQISGPMNFSDVGKFLNQDTESRWYGKGSGLKEFSLDIGGQQQEATGPLAELQKALENGLNTPVKGMDLAVGKFDKSVDRLLGQAGSGPINTAGLPVAGPGATNAGSNTPLYVHTANGWINNPAAGGDGSSYSGGFQSSSLGPDPHAYRAQQPSPGHTININVNGSPGIKSGAEDRFMGTLADIVGQAGWNVLNPMA